MLEAHELSALNESETYLEVNATFEERQKSRYRTQTTCGKDLGWVLERGYVLREGDVLKCIDGSKIKVRCAAEDVADVTGSDELLLLRAAYHLGNRHVPLQVERSFLRFQQDHVLEDMVIGLGLQVEHARAPFQPESGAYSGGAHRHLHHH